MSAKQQTLLAQSSTFMRLNGTEMPAWGAHFAHVLMDKFGNFILKATQTLAAIKTADNGAGYVPTLTLAANAVLAGWTKALGAAIDNVQDVTPLTGATVTVNTNGQNDFAYITPAGTIAALTYVFPSDANSRPGQVVSFYSSHIVTALTVTSTSLTLLGSALTAVAASTLYSWKKIGPSTWLRTA